jgi:hypothetical protein
MTRRNLIVITDKQINRAYPATSHIVPCIPIKGSSQPFTLCCEILRPHHDRPPPSHIHKRPPPKKNVSLQNSRHYVKSSGTRHFETRRLLRPDILGHAWSCRSLASNILSQMQTSDRGSKGRHKVLSAGAIHLTAQKGSQIGSKWQPEQGYVRCLVVFSPNGPTSMSDAGWPN